jgi:hypothetical protein
MRLTLVTSPFSFVAWSLIKVRLCGVTEKSLLPVRGLKVTRNSHLGVVLYSGYQIDRDFFHGNVSLFYGDARATSQLDFDSQYSTPQLMLADPPCRIVCALSAD